MNPAATTDLEALRLRLKTILRAQSVRTGEFTLVSGKKSDFYVDGKMTTLHPEGAYCVGRLVFERLRGRGLQAQGGLTLGADPMAAAVAAVSHLEGEPLPAFIVRKEVKGHGTSKRVEGHLPAGARVAVVEDVTTTGGSALQAVEAVRAAGGEVALVVTLVDRQEGGAENLRRAGIPFEAIFTRAEILETGAA
ncbi:MAG: orotate phosphoribosyltransferase [Planctomycetes bacterium]|nr:orotate phosphoribosyltransferase [Planctomycetota bacterium]